MLIKIEDLTPKNLINFYPSTPLCAENKAQVFVKNDLHMPEMVANILSVDGVQRCFISDKLIGVMFADSANKEDVKALVLAEIDDYFAYNGALIATQATSDELQLIEALADSFIRPTLNRDKGDIRLIEYTNGNLVLQFVGHCAGCPYAQNTLNNVIAGCLKRYMPQINSIKTKE